MAGSDSSAIAWLQAIAEQVTPTLNRHGWNRLTSGVGPDGLTVAEWHYVGSNTAWYGLRITTSYRSDPDRYIITFPRKLLRSRTWADLLGAPREELITTHAPYSVLWERSEGAIEVNVRQVDYEAVTIYR